MNVPTYNCYYKGSGKLSRIEYDGKDIPFDEVYDLCWRKPRTEPYTGMFRLPEDHDRFIEYNPHGGGAYAVNQGKEALMRYLESLRASVDAAHPYTTWMLDDHNHPSFHLYSVSYDDDIYVVDPEEGTLGWETLDGAELVFVKVAYAISPIFAIKLPKPVKLREPNLEMLELGKWLDSLDEARRTVERLFEEDGFEEQSGLSANVLEELKAACDKLENKHELLKAVGRL